MACVGPDLADLTSAACAAEYGLSSNFEMSSRMLPVSPLPGKDLFQCDISSRPLIEEDVNGDSVSYYLLED